MSVYVYASVCDFVCIDLLSPFVLGFYPSVFFVLFCFHLLFKKNFLNNYFLFFILITILFYFTLFYFVLFLSCLLFFLPFILSHVDERLWVLQSVVSVVPMKWESQLQNTSPKETSQFHVISNGDNLPEISISMPRPSFTQRLASYSAGHPMPNN